MSNIEEYTEKTFESIKHIDEYGNEFWEARELMPLLEYSKWENFHKVIKRAMIACETSNNKVSDHFPEFRKMVDIGSKTKRETIDYHLSRYACYLIVQNANPRKKSVALGQTYFAVQTRKQEITELEYSRLTEDEKRLYTRILVNNKNKYLFKTAREAGVENFGKFNNYGYKGLYNGETAKQIAKRKNIKENEDILDYMGSEELGANLFRITQTEAKLKKDNIDNEDDACLTHYNVGRTVRKAIEELGGNMPETLPTPEKSIKELEKDELQKIKMEIKGNKYKLVYLDTNAISEISKNYKNTFINFFEYFNFFKQGDCDRYALVTTVYNMHELNKTRDEYKNKIIEKFDLIPVLLFEAFPQIVTTELNNDDPILFATGAKTIMNNQFSTIFQQLTKIEEKSNNLKQNLDKEINLWNKERKNISDLKSLFSSSYSFYDTHNSDYNLLFESKSSKIFSYIKYHFIYESSKPIHENSIIDSYNSSIAPFVDVYVGERTVTSWLEKSKDKYDFMTRVECIKISEFYDKI